MFSSLQTEQRRRKRRRRRFQNLQILFRNRVRRRQDRQLHGDFRPLPEDVRISEVGQTRLQGRILVPRQVVLRERWKVCLLHAAQVLQIQRIEGFERSEWI